jgi:hypothetical protein
MVGPNAFDFQEILLSGQNRRNSFGGRVHGTIVSLYITMGAIALEFSGNFAKRRFWSK